jgi:beta-mannosidase
MRKLTSFLALVLLAVTATAQTVDLNGSDWSLSFWVQPEEAVTAPAGIPAGAQCIPATVPGNVDIDLMAAGLEADPRIGNNNYLTRKWECYQWCYTKDFNVPALEPGRHYELFFGGIDTIADIWLNGEHVGRAENMMIEHVYDVTKLLRAGSNKLQVIIQSSVIYGRKPFFGAISFGHSASPESVNIRKAPHTFGWDILPRVVSAGLWRKVELRKVEPVRIRDVYWLTATIDTAAHSAYMYADLQVEMPVERYDKSHAVFTLSRNGKVVYKASQPMVYHALRQKFTVNDVEYWWPRGYGEPALYDGKVEIVAEDGTVLATDVRKVGIRTVKLDFNEINLPEAPGRFCFIINGEPIFIHGTNWVPLDALHSRDPLWVDKTVELCADMNCNMIRCWGGNVYEDHRFFELCDEYGIMVWQDFTFACNAYPQDEDFGRRIWDEAKAVVIKLRQHPSIALWSGNNEIDYSLRRAISCFDPDPNKDNVSRNIIAKVIWEFDPSRPFIPSSPYYTEEVWKRGFIDYEHLPENHLWGPRGYYKTPFYTEAGCVFVSEIGYHGAPDISSLRQMMTPGCVYPWLTEEQLKAKEKAVRAVADAEVGGGSSFACERGAVVNPMGSDRNWNEEWLTKSVRRFPELGKTYDRNNLMINQQNLLFGSCPTDLEQFIFGSQVVQAEAMKYFVEFWRGQKFAPKTGIIWWNVKDGWPDISDAVVDYYFNKKLAYYFIKNVQSDVCCLMMDAKDGFHPLVAVNDTRFPVDGSVKVTDVASGRTVYSGKFHVAKNSKADVAGIPEKAGGQGVYLITYTVGGREYKNHYLYGTAPFKLGEYREWMEKTGIYDLSVQ